MSIDSFIQDGGLKALSLAQLEGCEYAVFLYLFHCKVSGLDQIITTELDIAEATGYSEKAIDLSLRSLSRLQMVRIRCGDDSKTGSAAGSNSPSISLSCELDMSRWSLAIRNKIHRDEASVYRFGQGSKNLSVITGTEAESADSTTHEKSLTWQRIVESFLDSSETDHSMLEQAKASAKQLIETHPVDQVLLMIRHFARRIPSLAMLQSSWAHYQEVFEAETQKVDFADARQKHEAIDSDLKACASQWLEQASSRKLSQDEISILQLLIRHRHPRRQLFWAYQMRSRYQNLSKFFEENSNKMLAVTTTGTVIKNPGGPRR